MNNIVWCSVIYSSMVYTVNNSARRRTVINLEDRSPARAILRYTRSGHQPIKRNWMYRRKERASWFRRCSRLKLDAIPCTQVCHLLLKGHSADSPCGWVAGSSGRNIIYLCQYPPLRKGSSGVIRYTCDGWVAQHSSNKSTSAFNNR